MNLLLLEDADFTGAAQVRISGRRHRQLREVLGVEQGTVVRCGKLGGKLGRGRVLAVSAGFTELEVELFSPPPVKLPVTLICALPRPKTLLKVLHGAVSMGVEKLIFLETWKVEKSYWQSPLATPEGVREAALLALEQSGDTVLPEIGFRRLFKPFVEDELPGVAAGGELWFAHPRGGILFPPGRRRATVLVGPEGGFSDYELQKIAECGGEAVNLGERVLRTEFAVAALLARLV